MLRWRCAGMLLSQRQSRNALCCRLPRTRANRPSKALCFPASPKFKQRNLDRYAFRDDHDHSPGIEMTARNPCQVLACRNGVSIFLGGRWIRIIPRGVVMSTIRGDEANEPTADNAPPRLPDGKLCYY